MTAFQFPILLNTFRDDAGRCWIPSNVLVSCFAISDKAFALEPQQSMLYARNLDVLLNSSFERFSAAYKLFADMYIHKSAAHGFNVFCNSPTQTPTATGVDEHPAISHMIYDSSSSSSNHENSNTGSSNKAVVVNVGGGGGGEIKATTAVVLGG